MLKEGEEYVFTAEKEILTPDGKSYRILMGPDKIKYLLRTDFYREYGIKEGEKVICRVDKINCRGEVFLEPRHPVYETGKKYDFKVVSHEIRSDDAGKETSVIIVEDVFGNKIAVPAVDSDSKLPDPGTNILLKVEKISRGKPVLYRTPIKNGRFKGLRYGKYYDFRTEKITIGLDNKELYVVSDPYGRLHTIPVQYYKHYNISPGKVFRGRIIKHSRDSSWKIEPLNPYYNKGDILDLQIESVLPDVNGNYFIIRLKDKFGFVHTTNSKNKPESNFVKCRVKRIRKGKPELAIL